MFMSENLTERLPKKFEKLSSFFEILRIFKWSRENLIGYSIQIWTILIVDEHVIKATLWTILTISGLHIKFWVWIKIFIKAKNVGPKKYLTYDLQQTVQSKSGNIWLISFLIRAWLQLKVVLKFYVKLSSFLGIFTGTLSCIVKLPDEVCAGHTKCVGYNKTIVQLKTFSEVLLSGLSF